MATLDRFPYSSAPVKRVKAIQFGILDPDFVVSKAATKRKKAAIGAFLCRRVRTALAVAAFFPRRSALLFAALVVALCFDCSESLVQPPGDRRAPGCAKRIARAVLHTRLNECIHLVTPTPACLLSAPIPSPSANALGSAGGRCCPSESSRGRFGESLVHAFSHLRVARCLKEHVNTRRWRRQRGQLRRRRRRSSAPSRALL